MKEIRQLWVVEQRERGRHKWTILPNAVQLRKVHADFDMKMLREDFPDCQYRVASYIPREAS